MLQFHLTRLFGSRFKTHGVAIPEQQGLRLVFREGEAERRQLFDEKIQSVLIQWDNIAKLEVDRGFFGNKLTLAVVSTAPFSKLPGLKTKHVDLKIHRSNYDQIEPFEKKVIAYRSGSVDENVDDFIDDVRDFLDR